jgi:hypothetical protein
VNCWFVLISSIDDDEGDTVSELSCAGATVKDVDAVIAPNVAVIVAVPVATDVAKPSAVPELAIVATAVFDELHVTEFVMFWLVLSVYVPLAANCSLAPRTMLGDGGVTVIDFSAAAVTVTLVVPEMPAKVAVITVAPWLEGVTNPLVAPPVLTVAT